MMILSYGTLAVDMSHWTLVVVISFQMNLFPRYFYLDGSDLATCQIATKIHHPYHVSHLCLHILLRLLYLSLSQAFSPYYELYSPLNSKYILSFLKLPITLRLL